MRYLTLIALLAIAILPASSQDIVTAEQFFNQVSERYGLVDDYEAALTISTARRVMKGTLYFKAPSLLRIDFKDPPDQVIAFDGQTLTVYIPELRAVLSQAAAEKNSGAASPALATREGLKMMKRNYTIAYDSSPAPQSLDEKSQEQVVCLLLSRKTVAEGYKTMKLYVAPDSKLIRRITGWTLSGEEFSYDFQGIKINLGIPAARFVYDSPASANVYNNFLFKSDNP